MSLSRDGIQGFIDGFIAVGGDPKEIGTALANWLKNHPTYPMNDSDISVIISDLESYRGVPKS